MIQECKELKSHCPVCSLELNPVEGVMLNHQACVYHSYKPRRASILYAMAHAMLDAIIYNAKRRVAKKNMESIDKQICYQSALSKAWVREYHDLKTLRKKVIVWFWICRTKELGELDEQT